MNMSIQDKTSELNVYHYFPQQKNVNYSPLISDFTQMYISREWTEGDNNAERGAGSN